MVNSGGPTILPRDSKTSSTERQIFYKSFPKRSVRRPRVLLGGGLSKNTIESEAPRSTQTESEESFVLYRRWPGRVRLDDDRAFVHKDCLRSRWKPEDARRARSPSCGPYGPLRLLQQRLRAPNCNLALGWWPHADVNPDLGRMLPKLSPNEPDCPDRQTELPEIPHL